MVEDKRQYQIRLPDGSMSKPMSLSQAKSIQKKLRRAVMAQQYAQAAQQQALQHPQARGIITEKGRSYY